MTDEVSPAKKVKLDSPSLPECPYGARCYRKNPQHFKEYSHSAKVDGSAAVDSVSASIDTVVTKDSIVAKIASIAQKTADLPLCRYGEKCYRKNLLHFAEFSHPASHLSADPDQDGNDTDVIDTDDDDVDDIKKTQKVVGNQDILTKDLSLVRRFSQLSDEERKELVKRAFEEKLRLQQELEGAKKLVEDKNKELEHLQTQMNTGLLLMDGEAEALKKTSTTYFPLLPERSFKEGSASQMHFRLAESQFYRLVTGDHAQQIRVIKVEYVVSPKVVERFRAYQAKLKKERGEKLSYPILGFHGTDEKNIKPICKNGFKTPGDSGFNHRTDAGYYGAGVYFSEYPAYSMGYIKGSSKLMLCQVLPGKVYNCEKLIVGSALVKGYDSHVSPCQKELVIFHSAAILPCYVIYFTNAEAVFKYTAPKVKKHSMSLCDKDEAVSLPGSTIFTGVRFCLTGKLSDTHNNIFTLIEKHGGEKGTKLFDVLIASEEYFTDKTAKAIKAEKKCVAIVPEVYLYDCIVNKTKLPLSDYKLQE